MTIHYFVHDKAIAAVESAEQAEKYVCAGWEVVGREAFVEAWQAKDREGFARLWEEYEQEEDKRLDRERAVGLPRGMVKHWT